MNIVSSLIRFVSVLAVGGLLLSGADAKEKASAKAKPKGVPAEAKPAEHAAEAHPEGLAPEEALAQLKAGNARFVGGSNEHPHQDAARRTELAAGQQPYAVILGCADSRTPPEVLFDQGLGDLFVVRVAGNIVDDANIASIEYAVDHLGSRLIVVLGHENCGAVKAARDTIAAKAKAPGHLGALVNAIAPAVKATVGKDLDETVKANVANIVSQLAKSKPVLEPKVTEGEIKVIGARYDLDTGAVEFVE